MDTCNDACTVHEHHHDHDADCGCGHDHEHHHDHGAVSHTPTPQKHLKGAEKRVYTLENLGCAHCAAQMEAKISQLPEVAACSLTYATRQLRVEAVHPDALLPQLQAICASVESDVKVIPRTEKKPDTEDDKSDLPYICIGAGALILGKVLEHLLPATQPLPCSAVALAVFLLGYLLCGFDVLKQAAVNLRHGRALDESFLMSIATLGAFAIGEYAEALGVMLFYRVGEYFEDRAVEKSRSNIMEALDLRPEVVNLLSGDEVETIPAEDAVPGDLLLIRPGDRIPLDGRIETGESLLDTSAITGEPVPVTVRPGDSVVSGCVNQDGVLYLRVEKPLSESMVTRILDSVETAAAAKPRIDRFISRFCRVYTPIVVLLAALTALIPSLITGNWWYWVKTALTFLVISCPCALVLSVPLAFFAGIGRGSRQNILFKGGSAMEAICTVKAVVMDKTGTLTRGVFSVQQLIPAEGIREEYLLTLAAQCESASTHPIAQSIRRAAEERELTVPPAASLREHPGMGVEADGILCGNRKLMEAHGVAVPDQAQGFGTEVLVAQDGRYCGCLLIADAVKPESAKAVATLKAQGIRTVMLTGDAEDSARSVAQAVGLDEVHARLLPQDKLAALQQIRQQYGPVMFVGDGINDAPVLAGADVGAAMGSGADAAIEAADVVFMTSRMDAVPAAIALGRRATRISRQNVVLAIAIKLLVILLGFFGLANMWAAVFADTGVAMLCVLNSIRILYQK